MSFDVKKHGGYGTGKQGDIEIYDGAFDKLNSYARVISSDGATITLDGDTIFIGGFEDFTAGNEILIHVSAGDAENLGEFLVAKIISADENILTLDKNFDCDFTKNYVQAVTIAQIDCLNLGSGAILTPQPYNPYKFRGGILALKVKNRLEFSGGNIPLTDCGIPTNKQNLRPSDEPILDADFGSGEENFCRDKLPLNCGDGAAFILARKIIFSDTRIGNLKTHGKAHCRGASDSNSPANVTNIGGSSILIAAQEIQNFKPEVIAKYRSADLPEGRGLCRCYISSETVLPYDEGLYSYDRIKNPKRLVSLNITNFGDGSFGSLANPDFRLNNFARVLSIEGYRLTYADKTGYGLAALQKNSLVMIHSSDGRFYLAKILSDDGSVLTLDFPTPKNFSDAQIISIPQFTNFTLNKNFAKIPAYNGVGGIFAIAVNEICDLSEGIIDVENKGGGENLEVGNSQMADRLPIGSPHGAVFILARKIIFSENSRIGIKEPEKFGANVFIVADSLKNFSSATLAKGLNPQASFKNPDGGFAFVYANNA